MANEHIEELEGRLAEAVSEVREATVPKGPSEELMRRAIEGARVRARDEGTPFNRKEWWKMMLVKRLSAAAGIAIVVTLGVLWLVWGRGAGVAFANVVDQVNKVQAVRCTISVEMQLQSPKGPQANKTNMDVLMAEPGWVISSNADMKMVMNQAQGKMMMLSLKDKQATLIDGSKMPATNQVPSLLDYFKKLQGKESKPLGEKEIDGRKAQGFATKNAEGSEGEIWADVETQRPVLVKMAVTNAMFPSAHYTFSDFDWNPTYDQGELTFDVPEGFKVSTMKMDMSEQTEADVVKMLQTASELNNGIFPDNLGMQEMMSSVANWMKAQGLDQKTATDELKTKLMKKFAPIARGWGYMAKATNGTDWHYAGKGVKVGEKDRPVLWYKPTGATLWRVFDADLAIHDAKDSELPEGTLVKMGFGMSAAPTGVPTPAVEIPVKQKPE